MSKISFRVTAPPFSVNKAYYLKSYNSKTATKIRTKECRDWGDGILLEIQPQKEEMIAFQKQFNEKLHALRINLVFGVPKEKFFTKAGHISIASCDITNIEKLLVDVIFDERFNGRALSGGLVSNLNINDKFIVQMVSTKVPSNDGYYIQIDVDMISNKEIL